jgi:hypothetical protein
MKRSWRTAVAAVLGAALLGAGAAPDLQRFRLGMDQLYGFSGADLDAVGLLLAVSEHQHVVARIRIDGSKAELEGPPVRIEGISSDLDAESLAVIDAGTWVIGTESQAPARKEDLVFLLQAEGDKAAVTETIAMPYAAFALEAGKNHGIESLCAASGVLLAGSEAVGRESGMRFAPLGRYDLGKKQWTAFRLRLTSDAGRLASLACRPASEQALEAVGIERQFGVMRLLRFQVPVSGPGRVLEPELILDLARLIPNPPNFEGVAWLPDGRVALISDNETGGSASPTELLVLRLP